MRKSIGLMVLSLMLTRACSAQTLDQDKLREAIQLPEVSVNFQFNFTSFEKHSGIGSPTGRLAALRKSLHGNASDAETYIKIGDIYGADPLNDTKQARVAYNKAVPLFRRLVKAQPHNGWLKARLGTSLFYTQQYAEAEKMHREAVRISPKDWRTWTELGNFVQVYAMHQAGFRKTFQFTLDDSAAVRSLLGSLLNKEAAPAKVTLLKRAAAEARADYDHAVALAPNVPGPYEARSGFFWIDQLVTQNLIKLFQSEKPDYRTILPAEAQADLWKAADLAPRDSTRQAAAAFGELMALMVTIGEDLNPGTEGAMERLPARDQERMRTLIERLRKIAVTPDRFDAEMAAVPLTTVYFFLGEMDEAEKMAKRAVALNPRSIPAWDIRCGIYVQAKKYEELAAALEERLNYDDTPHVRLMLAKAYEQLSLSTLASQRVLSAVKRFPNDLLLNLAAVDVLLRQPEANALAQAADPMAHATTLFAKMSDEDQKTHLLNMNLTHGAYLAMHGKVDGAKQAIQKALSVSEDNEEAKDIMEVLEDAP